MRFTSLYNGKSRGGKLLLCSIVILAMKGSLCLFFHLDDFLALVVAAVRANSVGSLQLATLGALGKSGHFQLPNVGASFILASLGMFSLRYCHNRMPPLNLSILLFKQLFEHRKTGVARFLPAAACAMVKVGTTLAAQAFAVLFAQHDHGQFQYHIGQYQFVQINHCIRGHHIFAGIFPVQFTHNSMFGVQVVTLLKNLEATVARNTQSKTDRQAECYHTGTVLRYGLYRHRLSKGFDPTAQFDQRKIHNVLYH
jgi:hypothetical protein